MPLSWRYNRRTGTSFTRRRLTAFGGVWGRLVGLSTVLEREGAGTGVWGGVTGVKKAVWLVEWGLTPERIPRAMSDASG